MADKEKKLTSENVGKTVFGKTGREASAPKDVKATENSAVGRDGSNYKGGM